VYRRYASLFFVCGIDNGENELLVLEMIHRYVEVLDKHFVNVSELDLIFNFAKAYTILDEILMAGELADSSNRAVLRSIAEIEAMEAEYGVQDNLREAGLS